MSDLPREKPGVKTSEFWLTLLVPVIVTAAKAYAPWLPEGIIEWAIAAAVTYIGGRAGLKIAQSIGEAKVAAAKITSSSAPSSVV